MIAILLTDVHFEEDIRELFMAYYPGENYTHEPGEDAMIVFSAKRSRKDEYSKDREMFYISASIVWKTSGEKESFTIQEGDERIQTKDNIKKALYTVLMKHEDHALPWGMLTGIRPTKIALGLLENGKTKDEVSEYFRQHYLTAGEKSKLCTDIALTEMEVLKRFDYKSGWSLYIGIPFCPTTCLYCSFSAYPVSAWKDCMENYVTALCRELDEIGESMSERPLQTIYIGGGTPTSLSAKQLDRVLEHTANVFNLDNLLEYTVEAGRPDSISREKLEIIKKYNVGRISINPQTLKQKTLNTIGRHHSVEQFYEAFEMARDLSFNDINTDLIVGLPGEDTEDIKHTMECIAKLSPEDVTVHALAIKRAARLNREFAEYAEEMHPEFIEDMIREAGCAAKDMNLHPYYMYRQKNMAGNFENVGYCKPGHEGIYNILIMEERQSIIACGAGATTRLCYPKENRIERLENVKDPGLYIDRLERIIEGKKREITKYLQIL